MSHFIFILVVIAAGALLSVQAAVNGRLSQNVGVLRASFLTFLVGTVVTGLLILYFEPVHALGLLDVPRWQLSGALFGVCYMVVMVAAVPILGVGIATVAVISGQLTMGILIDVMGWLGNAKISPSSHHVAAVICLIMALILMYISHLKEKGK